MAHLDDKEILIILKNRETRDKGFSMLMDKYKERIYWYIRRLVVTHEDAEDVLQETFINAYRYVSSFKEQSSLFTWLYKIATNESIAFFRRNNKNNASHVEISVKLENQIKDNNIENSDEMLAEFHRAILQLPEKQRIVFNLRYFDDLSYEEMKVIMGSSVNTLKTNYHYATEKIKNYLSKE